MLGRDIYSPPRSGNVTVATGTEETYRVDRCSMETPRAERCHPNAVLQSEPVHPIRDGPGHVFAESQDCTEGAAGGPSGMRTVFVRPLLDNDVDSNRFFEVSQGQDPKIPSETVGALPVDLRKPNGGGPGIVVGDVSRRLVAKTMHVSTIHGEVPECHKAVPICSFNQSRLRKHCTRGASFDRQ